MPASVSKRSADISSNGRVCSQSHALAASQMTALGLGARPTIERVSAALAPISALAVVPFAERMGNRTLSSLPLRPSFRAASYRDAIISTAASVRASSWL
jgi:hypothetical protein